MHPKITFTKSAASFVLSAIGKSINDKGQIVEKKSGKKTYSVTGKVMTLKNFGGCCEGKFYTDDLFSIMQNIEEDLN